MMAAIPTKAPVVIIGGGIIGISVLYHLAKRGVSAIVLERKRVASGTTWHAAGIVGQLRDSTSQTELAKYTVKLFSDLEIETGQPTGYKQNGTINLALSDVRHEQLLRQRDHALRMQVPAELLDVDQLLALWPYIDPHGVVSALYVPSNGQVNALDVTVAMAKGAKANGGQIVENCVVDGLTIRNGRVVGVETDQGSIATDQVVLAAGMWSHKLAKAHGINVPLQAMEHWYIVTEPISGLPSQLPILNISEERTYWKPDAGKLLIGGFEEQGRVYQGWGKSIPKSFEFDELPFDMDHAAPELGRMFARMPSLENLGIQTFFNGPESFTTDAKPYLGPANEIDGVFLATGMNSNGILNSGGVGLTLAQWLIDGAPSRTMAALSPSRAMEHERSTRFVTERGVESIGFHYGLHWPGRQVEQARFLRQSPVMYPWKSAGAVTSQRAGWEVPMYFETRPEDQRPESQPSIGWQTWSPMVQQECLAARDSCAVLDQSMYGKILVQGPDALRALDWVSGARIDVPVGRTVYTQFLNSNGGIEADITILRMAHDKFMVITGHPAQVHDSLYIQRQADPNWRFEIFDATSGYALISIHGPNSRDLLQALTMADVSDQALPFGSAVELDLASVRGWAIRRSYVGELGFELLFPTECALYIAAEVQRLAPQGTRLIGMYALNACRLEKGFRHLGHDIGDDDTPLETGLGFAVDFSKDDFLGKAALEKQRSEGPTPDRTVCLAVPTLTAEQGPYLIHNEPIWTNGDMVGYVTSGGWGWRVGQMLGLGTLHNSQGVTQDWLNQNFEVQIAGQFYPAEVRLSPFYDPKSLRMKG